MNHLEHKETEKSQGENRKDFLSHVSTTLITEYNPEQQRNFLNALKLAVTNNYEEKIGAKEGELKELNGKKSIFLEDLNKTY